MTKQPMPTSYPCQQCGRRDGLDAVLTDELWEQLTGRKDGGGLLCLWCMDEIAAEKGIVGYVMLHFAGRALVGGDGPTIWDDSELTVQLLEANNRCVRLVAELTTAQEALAREPFNEQVHKANTRLAVVQFALDACEKAMDTLNGDTGTKSRPCSFCRAETYDAQVGIIHQESCPLLAARAALKDTQG